MGRVCDFGVCVWQAFPARCHWATLKSSGTFMKPLSDRAQTASVYMNTPRPVGHSTPRGCGLLAQARVRSLVYYLQHSLCCPLTSSAPPSLSAGCQFLTVVGSSNFGVRSVERDLELQFVIEGADAAMAEGLAQERDALFQHSSPVSDATFQAEDRRIIEGLRWSNGSWLHFGWKLFRPYM